jgi:hypothetical protein
MHVTKDNNRSSNRSIPVGRLVSVTSKKSGSAVQRMNKLPSSHARPTQPKRQPVAPRRGFKKYLVFGGVTLLLHLSLLGLWFVQSGEKSLPKVAESPVAGQQEDTANDSPTFAPHDDTQTIVQIPKDAELEPKQHASGSRIAEDSPALHAALERMEPLPKVIPSSPAVVSVAPRNAKSTDIPVVAVPIAEPATPKLVPQSAVESHKTEESKASVADMPAAAPLVSSPPAPKVVKQAPKAEESRVAENGNPFGETKCEQFGTKIDFRSTPTEAYELAKKDKNKIVMVLQIAGNFEDQGFT